MGFSSVYFFKLIYCLSIAASVTSDHFGLANKGATLCTRTLQFVVEEKSSCFVMQLILSTFPSIINFRPA